MMKPSVRISAAHFLIPAYLGVLIAFAPEYRCQTPQDPKIRTAEEDNIREGVLRFQMVSWYRGADEEDRKAAKDRGANGPHDMNYKTFLVSIGEKDPTDDFLCRFKDIPRRIKPASKEKFEKEPFPGWLHDRDTNDRVVEFYVGQIDWKSESQAEASGGYYCGGLCGALYVFKLKKTAGKWIVTTSELKAIS